MAESTTDGAAHLHSFESRGRLPPGCPVALQVQNVTVHLDDACVNIPSLKSLKVSSQGQRQGIRFCGHTDPLNIHRVCMRVPLGSSP